MHVDHELVEFMPMDEQDYEEVIEEYEEEICHRTDQFIRAQVQKQSSKRSNSRTWAHINPVVNWNHEEFQTNLHTTKITVIQHNISHVTTFHK